MSKTGCTMCKDEAWSCTKPAISTGGCGELFTETFRSHTVQLAIHLFLRRASDTGMLRSDNHKKKKNPTPTWRRRRRRDIAEHEIQHGHKPLSQKCNLAISFAYLLIHLLLI